MLNSRIKKLIFILGDHFCERDYNRFGVELLEANGFEVLVWEITPIINPKGYYNTTVKDSIKYKGHRIFYNKLDVCSNIIKVDNDCLFIIVSRYCYTFYEMLRIISDRKIPYCFEISGGSYPQHINCIDNISKVNKVKMAIINTIDKFKKLNYKLIREHIFQRLSYRLLHIKPADFIIAGGAKSNIQLYRLPIGSKTKILFIHYYDYDNYLTEIRHPSILDQTTGVFLDEYAPFHPDQFFNGAGPLIKPEKYYHFLRKFFDYLEGSFNVKIIIAAHPRSHYEKNHDYFGGRPVIKNKTCELVRQAGFVIAHRSYSINYAVLFKKPILFLTSDEFEKTSDGPYIKLMASMLGKTSIFMDKPYALDWEAELTVNMARYREYKQNHIKMEGTEELLFWQVVANYIKSNY